MSKNRRPLIAGMAAAVFATVGIGVAGLQLAAGTAHADKSCSPANMPPHCAPPEGPPGYCNADLVCSQIWCPAGGPIKNMPDWDTNVCHTYYFDPNSPLTNSTIIPGQPPGPPMPPPPPCIIFINCLPGL